VKRKYWGFKARRSAIQKTEIAGKKLSVTDTGSYYYTSLSFSPEH
jgi:hypothetical protein